MVMKLILASLSLSALDLASCSEKSSGAGSDGYIMTSTENDVDLAKWTLFSISFDTNIQWLSYYG